MKKNVMREKLVLKSLVVDYIKTNETVSSRVICKNYIPSVSPATIRIDLHKLEKKNLIYQPHTSAGRIPTLQGFRDYTEQIEEEVKTISYEKSDFIREFLAKNYKDTPLALHYIMQILAKETDQLSFVAEPEMSYGFLRKIEVFKIAHNKLLFVVSLDSGLDKTVILNCDYDISEQQLKVLVRYANEEFMGLRIFDIMNTHLEKMSKKMNQENKLLSLFLQELNKALLEISNYYIHFDGNISFLEQPEFDSKKNILVFLDLMQRHDYLINVMEKNKKKKPYHIVFGEEFGRMEWYNFVLIYSKYEIFGVPGYLGILAPVRMDYLKNIPIIRDIAKTITDTTKKGMMVPQYGL